MNNTRTWQIAALSVCSLCYITCPAVTCGDTANWATPEQQLVVASYRAELDRVRELLQQGVDPNVQFGEVDRNALPPDLRRILAKWSPLLAAVGGGAHDAASQFKFPRVPANDERRVALVTLLLEWGANVDTVDNHGADALVLAMRSKHFASIEPLLRAGADPNVRIRAVLDGRSQHTPLHIAALDGALSAVKALLEHGADPNLQDENGDTALHDALRRLFWLRLIPDATGEVNDQLELICVLCWADANIYQSNNRKESPFEKAIGLARVWQREGDTSFDRAIRVMLCAYAPAELQCSE
jgi:hypothetical protein